VSTARVKALRKRQASTRDVHLCVAKAGDWIQVHMSARGTDRWMKLTEAEARQLVTGLQNALGSAQACSICGASWDAQGQCPCTLAAAAR
jgi:hypothetical protein